MKGGKEMPWVGHPGRGKDSLDPLATQAKEEGFERNLEEREDSFRQFSTEQEGQANLLPVLRTEGGGGGGGGGGFFSSEKSGGGLFRYRGQAE